MKNYPLAIIANNLGTRSETFINRHMTELLPGRTAVIAREKAPDFRDVDASFPYLIFGGSRRNLRWLVQSALFLVKLNKYSPVQIRGEQYLKQHHVRVVLSEYLHHSLKWIDVVKNLGARFYAHAHGCDVSETLEDPVMRRRYLRLEAADGIVTMSEHSRKRLAGLGLSDEKIHVIPYGVHVPDAPVRRGGRGPVRCLAVGRMVGKKAPLITLAAFQKALSKNPRLRLDYVGDGPLFDAVRQYVRDHELGERVTLHGGRPHGIVCDLMKKADIFVQHSRTDPDTGDEEGLPVAILEAMANSLPVGSTRHAGIPEAVIEGATGFLVDEGDVEGMASRISRLAKERDARDRLGEAGWERAKQRFSWETEKTALLELLGL